MNQITKLDPRTVSDGIQAGQMVLIDIREPDEHAREHINGALSLPVSTLDQAELTLEAGITPVFHCKSGMRTETNCQRLSEHVGGEVRILDGGIEAWKSVDLPVVKNTSAPIEIMRQVQITAGSLVLIGVILGFLVNSWFFGLSAFVGAGLTFAGVSGWCGMATILSAMPWNKTRPA